MDYLGPLPDGRTLFVVVDYYSRFIEVCEMTQITAKETILQLSKVFSRYGVPMTIRADNGPQLNTSCEEFKSFCEDMGIRLTNTIPYWPQQNGEVERQNRSILKRLRIAQELGQDWRRVLDQYILQYHSTPHPTTGRSPFELMFGRRTRSKLPQIPREIHVDEEVRDHDCQQKEKGRLYADRKRRARESDISVGDQVLVKRFRKDNKLSTDFSPEEHIVSRRSGADVTLRSMTSGKECRRNIAHLKKLPRNSPTYGKTPNPGPSTEEIQEQNLDKEQPLEQSTTVRDKVDSEDASYSRQHLRRIRKEPSKYNDYLSH